MGFINSPKMDEDIYNSSNSMKGDFNLEVVSSHFKKCLGSDRDLDIKEYLAGFHELCRFFRLTGPLFGFVAKDIEYKLKCVEHHLQSSESRHYATVQAMISRETERGIARDKTPQPSGCRMLLRLHWALEFIIEFMREIRDSEEMAKASKIAWQVYSKTLYHHHPWLTRRLASVAVYALPSKKQLIMTMCSHHYSKVLVLLDEVLEATQPVYDQIQNLLAQANLLKIA